MMRFDLVLGVLGVVSVLATGCTSTYARWGGERVVTGLDGAPLVDKDGVVQKVKEPVELSSLRHWTDSLIGQAAPRPRGARRRIPRKNLPDPLTPVPRFAIIQASSQTRRKP